MNIAKTILATFILEFVKRFIPIPNIIMPPTADIESIIFSPRILLRAPVSKTNIP